MAVDACFDGQRLGVRNTHIRAAHAIYLSNKDEILIRIALPNTDRELATEFMERQGLVENEHLVPRPVRGLGISAIPEVTDDA